MTTSTPSNHPPLAHPIAHPIARALRDLPQGDKLAPLLNQAACVSFDFFDTLFARPFAEPELVFDLLGRRLGIADFRAKRLAAQRAAFAHMPSQGRKEIRLSDIYVHFDASPAQQAQFAALEAELECSLLAPKPEVLALFHALGQAGIKRAICSDMYLPRSFFEPLLQQHGIDADWLLISAEENATKRDAGELFAALLEKSGLPAHQVLHLGDNHASDVQRAEQWGLMAFHYVVEHPSNAERSANIATLHGLWERCRAKDTEADAKDDKEDETHDLFQRLGFLYAGSANLGYLHWLSEQCQTDGIEHLLFLSRDGYLLEKLATLKDAPKLPKHHYFTGSRVAYYLAAITEKNFHSYLPFLLSGSEGLKPRELLERIGVTPPAAQVMRDIGLGDEVVVNQELHPKLAGWLYAWRAEILRVCARNRRALHLYLHQLGIHAGSKVGVVDVGWSGSTKEALQAAISPWLDIQVQGYYLVLADTPERLARQSGQAMRAMFDSQVLGEQTLSRVYANRAIIELFFSAPHATIIGWQIERDGSITPVMDAGRGGNPTQIQHISQRIIHVAEQFATCYQDLTRRMGASLSAQELALPLLHLAAFESEQCQAFAGQIVNFDTWSSSSNQHNELLSY